MHNHMGVQYISFGRKSFLCNHKSAFRISVLSSNYGKSQYLHRAMILCVHVYKCVCVCVYMLWWVHDPHPAPIQCTPDTRFVRWARSGCGEWGCSVPWGGGIWFSLPYIPDSESARPTFLQSPCEAQHFLKSAEI